jgi:prepilin-type N-terminal cleavage/methylation domain-containing protein
MVTFRAHPHAADAFDPSCEDLTGEAMSMPPSSDYNKSSSDPAPGARSMQRRTSRGFTLVEIAVVVALIAILLTAGAKIASGLLEGAAVSVTQKKQQAIKEALINFLHRNKRLPCPDTDRGAGNTLGFVSGPPDGSGNRVAGPDSDCAYPFGVVPFADLGLPQEMALDGWQNYFMYRVTESYAWNRPGAFNDGTIGAIVVTGRNADGSEKTITPVTDQAVFAIISVGSDGAGAWTVAGTRTQLPAGEDELANSMLAAFGALPAPMPPLWARDATDGAGTGGRFNDVVLYVPASEIFGRTTQSSQNDFHEKIARARLAILGHPKLTPSESCRLPDYDEANLQLRENIGFRWQR